MKIAIVGKGGSGKSSLSWLFANHLVSNHKRVLSIDADHNMDFAANLGLDPDEITNTIHRSEADFKKYIKLEAGKNYKTIPQQSLESYPTFSISTVDVYTAKYSTKLSENHLFMLGGIGQDDVLSGNKCAHAYLSPLKYYLGLLELKQGEYVVADSVAGMDMINFGLYAAMDCIIVSVENHINSVKVFECIKKANELIGTPVFAILNKYDITRENEILTEFTNKHSEFILGTMHLDSALQSYDYSKLSDENVKSIHSILSKLTMLQSNPQLAWERLSKLDCLKLSSN